VAEIIDPDSDQSSTAVLDKNSYFAELSKRVPAIAAVNAIGFQYSR